MSAAPDDFDSPWKILLDRWTRPFLECWHPRRYEHRLWGCRAVLEFPSVKLLDYADREAALEADPNPFALVVRAHLAALATRRNPAARLERKITLTRALYRHGWTREDVLSFYAFIDWVLALPDTLEADYHQRIREIEEGQHVQYVTTAERIGLEKGIEQGIQQGIEQGIPRGESRLLRRLLLRRFGTLPDWVETRLTEASSSELKAWGERLLDATTLDAIFRV